MSSSRALANVRQGSAFYVNIVTVTAADSYDATGVVANVAHCAGNAGTVLLRDMGKTVRVAAQSNTNHVASAPISLVLRKVQVVRPTDASSMSATTTAPLSSFVGLNDGVGGTAYDVFYIELCPASNGAAADGGKWARLSL
jgi:hypothetical protein